MSLLTYEGIKEAFIARREIFRKNEKMKGSDEDISEFFFDRIGNTRIIWTQRPDVHSSPMTVGVSLKIFIKETWTPVKRRYLHSIDCDMCVIRNVL